MEQREKKIINIFAHDFKDTALCEIDLANLFESFLDAINCNHQCDDNCEINGCNCDYGYRHID